MIDMTPKEIATTLFLGSGRELSAPRFNVLVAMVCDLLMEVEALRAAQLASNSGTNGPNSAYGRAYRDTAYLTHNSCGPSSGLDKLLARFYPAENDSGVFPAQHGTWRECLMLLRLGFTEDQIRTYQEDARQAESFT